MLGILYILVSFLTGFIICGIAFPGLAGNNYSYDGKKINLNPYFVLLPAWYVTGTLILTWAVYITAYIFRDFKEPLKPANMIVIPLFLVLCLIYFIIKKPYFHFRSSSLLRNEELDKIENEIHKTNNSFTFGEILLLLLIFILASLLMWTTFFVKNDQLYVGASVFSDFSPHIGMIRSFSAGNNFPTMYSHYSGEDIRYHFLFQFMVGNLEYLGLRLDYAFNIPSIIIFVAAFMVLYTVAVKISGKRAVGYVTCLLFAFRSSESLFTFLSQVPKGEGIFKALSDNKEFIGYTPNENWGLWNLNVYCNQRHLAFSITVMLILIILFLPNIYDRFKIPGQNIKAWFFTKEAWISGNIRLAIASGILLGLIAFWNGAVLIAALAVLFVIGISAKRRSELVIMAVIAISLAYLQARFFIKGNSISPKFYFGFISENPTLFGSFDYLKKLLGLLPFILFAAFLVDSSVKRYLMAAFTLPLVIAFTLSVTVDVTVNHKYIMLSVMLLNILAADFLINLFIKRDYWFKIGCVIIIVSLTGTGIYDFITVLRKNQPDTAVVLNLDDKLTKWIEDNSDSKDIFLTSNYALNQVVLGGAMLFQGWQYYAWSAGYNTEARDEQVKLMYEADDPSELKSLVNQNNIRFIIIDHDNRISEGYELNEENIRNTYAVVYQEGEGEWSTSIFDTRIPLKINKH
jgi:hypothetical protein